LPIYVRFTTSYTKGIQEIASALIAGVIVIVVDWKNSATAAPQNQLHLAECTCRKSCMVGCDVLRGWCLKAPTSPPLNKRGCLTIQNHNKKKPK